MKKLLVLFAVLFTLGAAPAYADDPVRVFWVDGDSMFDDSGCPTTTVNVGGDMCYVDWGDQNDLSRYIYNDNCECWLPDYFAEDQNYNNPMQLSPFWDGNGNFLGFIFVGSFPMGLAPDAWNLFSNQFCLEVHGCYNEGPGGPQ